MSEFYEEHAKEIEGELREIRGALLDDTIATLSPAAPVCLRETATVHEAVNAANRAANDRRKMFDFMKTPLRWLAGV